MADTNQELDIELIKKRAVSGIITFTLRTFFIQAYTFFATFILTILIAPEIFGIYFVVTAIINLFIYFSDVGLAAALIQKKQEPTREDLVTTFTIQQVIIIALIVLGLAFSNSIARFYGLDNSGLMLMRVLIFSLFLSSLKTIPSVLLERHLSFTRFVIPQVAENFVFYTLTIILAFLNFGLESFIWAVLARGIVGLVLIYALSPWKPALGFEMRSAKRLVSFGIPFQLNSIIALIKDDLLVVFLGKILPFAQVGYIGWAQRFAFVPLRFVMDNVIKVTFPAYSRFQHDIRQLSAAIEKSIFFVALTVFPIVTGMVAISSRVISTIPNYGKWEPAIPLLYFFAINAMFAAVNTTLTNTLFAIGKPNIVLKLMVFWTTMTWVLTFAFVKYFGFIGVAAASAVVAASTSIIIYFVKKEFKVAILKNIYAPLIASLIMLALIRYFDHILPPGYPGLVIQIVLGIAVYFGIMILLIGARLLESLRIVFASIRAID
ncbi:hypothetical protein A3G14_03555 [Candidatus Curtissbacteria bacterium RIFCSPLOWO2_12_FULL_38_9]|uniref:Uncharacterized protein n=1 Tax=Candidatus Curtissbacteria bacterium RIFCSPLOWO2_12_FULL_38_9 TaxID=1797735 RepID=A0A1F5I7E0_9BACT|nr:MAG: hypothetical protein A3G14_03555 [Candidatus Curtissbacteria bacterium RIFCSPLOWO2_12_FULL_38_9]